MKPKPLTSKELNDIIKRMPFNSLLGLRVTRVYADGISMEMPVVEQLKNGFDTLHGGAIATLVDAVAGVGIFGHFGGQRKLTTVELKVNYLRPASEGKVRARTRFLKVGKTLVVSACDITDTHGHLIATGLITYMLL